jgi:hypothetical protein
MIPAPFGRRILLIGSHQETGRFWPDSFYYKKRTLVAQQWQQEITVVADSTRFFLVIFGRRTYSN